MASHLVIIEDDLALQEVYRLLLEAEGYVVTISSTCYEDLDAFIVLHPDLLILDLLIDGKPFGWPFLQAVKSFPLTATLPILIVTAAEPLAPEWRDFAQREGIPLLAKPFNIDTFLLLVRQSLAPCAGRSW
jgi:DNA-binding response OmpR family regulator